MKRFALGLGARYCWPCWPVTAPARALQIIDDRGVTVTLASGAAAHHQPAAFAD
jgi:hypothetical protein